jgi:thiol-disulfide isomerase/thioredoxin
MSDELNRRRSLVFGAAAACAALGGAGLAWWQRTKEAAGAHADAGESSGLGQSAGQGSDGLASSKFWELTFDTPEGKPLDMASFKGKPLLINFWATWCPPCVEELPLIDRFYRENSAKGWSVLGLAVDQKSAVNGFLTKMPLSFPNALAGLSGVELSKSLGNLSGGLPFTVVIGAAGAVLHRKMGLVSLSDLGTWAQLK